MESTYYDTDMIHAQFLILYFQVEYWPSSTTDKLLYGLPVHLHHKFISKQSPSMPCSFRVTSIISIWTQRERERESASHV